jgi:hypothetical protein
MIENSGLKMSDPHEDLEICDRQAQRSSGLHQSRSVSTWA